MRYGCESMLFRSIQQQETIFEEWKGNNRDEKWIQHLLKVPMVECRRTTVCTKCSAAHRSNNNRFIFGLKWLIIMFIFGLAAIDLKNGIKCHFKLRTILMRWGQMKDNEEEEEEEDAQKKDKNTTHTVRLQKWFVQKSGRCFQIWNSISGPTKMHLNQLDTTDRPYGSHFNHDRCERFHLGSP